MRKGVVDPCQPADDSLIISSFILSERGRSGIDVEDEEDVGGGITLLLARCVVWLS